MITPATLLRDTLIAGVLLAVGGFTFWGTQTGVATAAGAVGGHVSLLLLVRMVSSMDGGLLGRVALHQAASVGILFALLMNLPTVPVLVGFFAVLPVLAAYAVVGIVRGPAAPAESR